MLITCYCDNPSKAIKGVFKCAKTSAVLEQDSEPMEPNIFS